MGIDIGSDFSGVGAFEQALLRLGIAYKTVFACDMDKYARQTYIDNYGEPDYFPENVYGREIPKKPLDIYMTSPPCQAFSLAGKRKGEDDKRGILFYNSHEFIKVNRPRYFIFENVKGLLSDDNGKTFQRWLDYLGGKSVNGNPVIFPHEESVPYHVYHQVLNAKDYGVPQNRERVFIIGIRDDRDNDFSFPRPQHLTKRLKDVLEENVDEKYYLSDKMLNGLIENNGKKYINQDTQASQVFCAENESPNICSGTHDYANGYVEVTNFQGNDIANSIRIGGKGSLTDKHNWDIVKVKSPLQKIEKLYDDENKKIEDGDIIQTGQTNMKGKRIYKTGISPTLPAENPRIVSVQNEKVLVAHVGRSEEVKKIRKESMSKGRDFTPFQAKEIEFKESDVMNCVTTATTKDNLLAVQNEPRIGAILGRGDDNNQQLEINETGNANSITTVQKDNVVVTKNYLQWDASGKGYASQQDRAYYENGHMGTIPAGRTENKVNVLLNNYRIRRLTVRECFRLMDFPDTFKWTVSDTQAYKQAGNSIVVNVLCEIIKKLNL